MSNVIILNDFFSISYEYNFFVTFCSRYVNNESSWYRFIESVPDCLSRPAPCRNCDQLWTRVKLVAILLLRRLPRQDDLAHSPSHWCGYP